MSTFLAYCHRCIVVVLYGLIEWTPRFFFSFWAQANPVELFLQPSDSFQRASHSKNIFRTCQHYWVIYNHKITIPQIFGYSEVRVEGCLRRTQSTQSWSRGACNGFSFFQASLRNWLTWFNVLHKTWGRHNCGEGKWMWVRLYPPENTGEYIAFFVLWEWWFHMMKVS